jgi:hypothetical protein
VSSQPIKITEYLLQDHVRLRALLDQATANAAFDEPAYAAFRSGLLRHIAIEEKLLLPAARRARGGERITRAQQLRFEHAALTSLLVPTPDAALCDEIRSILAEHDVMEEGSDGVYEECDRLLSPTESAMLATRAQAFAPVPVMPYFDGPAAHRTAASALASAKRMKPLG